MRVRALACIAVLVVSGCISFPDYRWNKAGIAPEVYQADDAECQQVALGGKNLNGPSNAEVNAVASGVAAASSSSPYAGSARTGAAIGSGLGSVLAQSMTYSQVIADYGKCLELKGYARTWLTKQELSDYESVADQASFMQDIAIKPRPPETFVDPKKRN